jgi:hypothetical protein
MCHQSCLESLFIVVNDSSIFLRETYRMLKLLTETPSLTSHKSLVPERQPTSLCELPIHICTTHHQKDGNLNDTIPPDRRKSEDRSETTTGCRRIRPPTNNPRAPSRAKGKPKTSSSSHARSPSTAHAIQLRHAREHEREA